jgi:hypothetical protein
LRLELLLEPPDTDLPAAAVMWMQPRLRLVSSAEQLEALNHTLQETVSEEVLQQPWQEEPDPQEDPVHSAAMRSYPVSMLSGTAPRLLMVLLCLPQTPVPQQALQDQARPYRVTPTKDPLMSHSCNHCRKQEA